MTLHRAFISMVCMATLLMGTSVFANQSAKSANNIIVAQDAHYPPFSQIGVNGEPEGYLIDVWRAFGRNNNLDIEFKLGTWQESLDLVKMGKADVHGGLIFSQDRDSFLDFGPTIVDISTALYTRKILKDDEAQTYPVGVVRGGYEEHFMRTMHPDRALVRYDNNTEMLTAAKAGLLSVFVADQPTSAHIMHELDIDNDFQNSETLYVKPLRAAVGEGQHTLLEMIHYGWIKIPEKELKLIQKRWFMIDDPTPGWIPGSIGIALLTLIAACIIRAVTRRIHHGVE